MRPFAMIRVKSCQGGLVLCHAQLALAGNQSCTKRNLQVLYDREETRPALASDTPDAHVEHPNAQAEDDRAEISHSHDFGSVTCHGREYTFTRNQAAIVKLRWEQGDAELGQDYILEEIDWTASRLRDVFKQKDGMHPAWGTWIVSGQTKGTFCLRPREKA